jgi:hypothetical protein
VINSISGLMGYTVGTSQQYEASGQSLLSLGPHPLTLLCLRQSKPVWDTNAFVYCAGDLVNQVDP